jgi:hypothetical protein
MFKPSKLVYEAAEANGLEDQVCGLSTREAVEIVSITQTRKLLLNAK